MSLKFYSATGQGSSDPALAAEYRAARAVGSVRVGDAHLFFRAGLRLYALPWNEVKRCYRRVMRVPLKMCCGSGNLDVESLVVEGASGELANIRLPGSRAARALMALLKEAAPETEFEPPAKSAESEAKA